MISCHYRSVLSPSRKPRRERYLTGHSVIDEPLSDVLQLVFRDYVLPWYSRLSSDESFLAHIKDLFHEVVVNLSNKAKDVDWVRLRQAASVLVMNVQSLSVLVSRNHAVFKTLFEEERSVPCDI